MHLPDFDYHAPRSVEEAVALLAELGPGASALAGGTDLLHKMKTGKAAPTALVSLKNIEAMRGIRQEAGRGVVIGALTTQNELCHSELLHARYFSVSDAAHQMASNQIRHLGTVGGNIVNAVPSADLPPILIALKATIRLAGPKGEREMALDSFFVEPASSVILPGELLVEVVIPDQSATGSSYKKFGLRRSGALAVAGAAAAVEVVEGIFKEVRIALASSAPSVMRAREAEAFLTGKPAVEESFAQAAKIVEKECRPRDSIRGSAEYRRNLAGVLTKRALLAAVTDGHGKAPAA